MITRKEIENFKERVDKMELDLMELLKQLDRRITDIEKACDEQIKNYYFKEALKNMPKTKGPDRGPCYR